MITNIPLLLTLARLLVSPVLLPLLIVYLLPLQSVLVNRFLGVLVAAFGLTDFFDGYLARRYGYETALGKLLDPLADKLLVYSVSIGLIAAHRLGFFWVILWLARDFFVMTLRHMAAKEGFSIDVSYLAKIKMTLQLCVLVFIVGTVDAGPMTCDLLSWLSIERGLLLLTTFFSIMSGYLYYRSYAAHSVGHVSLDASSLSDFSSTENDRSGDSW